MFFCPSLGTIVLAREQAKGAGIGDMWIPHRVGFLPWYLRLDHSTRQVNQWIDKMVDANLSKEVQRWRWGEQKGRLWFHYMKKKFLDTQPAQEVVRLSNLCMCVHAGM